MQAIMLNHTLDSFFHLLQLTPTETLAQKRII